MRKLGDEAPPDPRGVGAGFEERRLEDFQVQVGAVGRGTEVVRDVGFTHECGVAVDVGVQSDDLDGLTGLGR